LWEAILLQTGGDMSQLFRVPEFFVEGKHLEKLFTALTGIAINMKMPQPVHNATATKGTVKATPEAGKMYELVLVKLKNKFKSGDELTGDDIDNALTGIGHTSSSKGYVVKMLKDTKAIKVTGHNHYKLT
jgi:hypothetical protein